MSSEFNPLLWFVCKICRQAFPDTEKLKKHQIRKHAEHCKNVKCIVFEERFFDKQWIPSDNYFPKSSSEFTNENVIEVPPVTFKCGCHCHSISAVSVPAETQTKSYLQSPRPKHNKPNNPYVLVKKLTSEELNAALNRNAEKPIFESSCSPEERKRTSRCINSEDVHSPKRTKEYFSHQENHQDQDLLFGGNILVSPPELFQNLVTQTVELNTRVLPEPVEFSSTNHLSANSWAPPSCLEDIENVQNPEENRLEEAISFTLLEGEIHVELLSVIKEVQSSTEHPDPENQLLPKTKSHKRSPLSAEEQTRNSAKKPSRPSQIPYVLVKRLTLAESNPRCKGRKRDRDDNDVSHPTNTNYLQHQHQDHDSLTGINHSGCNPELFPEIVTPKAEPDRDAFPNHEQFSSISTLSDPLGNAPFDIKYVANTQNTEENYEQLPTGTQTLECQEQHIEGIGSSVGKKIWCCRSNQNSIETSTLAPSLSYFGSLSRAEVNDDNGNLSETNNVERIPIISDVYPQAPVAEDICPSDSECLEVENPISPELSDEVEFVEERHLPTSVVNDIGVADDDVQLTQISDTADTQLEGQPRLNEELDENIVCATSSVGPVLFSLLTSSSALPVPEPLDTSKSGLPGYSTRAKRKKPEVNYCESHICSYCNLDFDSFDDLQDHQRLCTMQHNQMDSVTNRNNRASANQRDKNGEGFVVQIDIANDSVHRALQMPLDIISSRVNRVSASVNSSKVRKDAPNATDDDSDYTADGDEDVSENENNEYIKPVVRSGQTLSKKKKLKEFSTSTVPQHRIQSKLNEKEKNLALFKWLEAQKKLRFPDGSKNKIYLCTESFLMSKALGPNNHIKCKLCKIQLETESKLKNHVINCWLHNQSNHVYCIPCGKLHGSPQSLAKHFQNEKYAAQHANFRRSNGLNVLDSNADDLNDDRQRPGLASDTDFHPTDPASSLQDLPLLQWLKIQHKNPDIVVALEPDPFESNRDNPVATFTVNESFPIKCKLCLQLLTSDVLLRNHVERCWSQNKSKHRYCVPCNKYYKTGFCFRQHQRCKHKNELYQKQKQEPLWTCNVCHKDMEKKFLFNLHRTSLQIFLGKGSETSENLLKKSNPDVDSTQNQYVDIPGQEATMKNLLEWLKHIRKIPNSEGTANLILIDPDPTTYSSGELGKDRDKIEINEDNPITCRLCLKKSTQIEDVKNHVKMCWSQNKESHRYCLSCDKGFATPTELQEHRTSDHSAPKNIILFYREEDGDGSMLNVDGLEVNADNPVICKLCETELTSAPEVKIHGDNCWFHNKSRHVYCTICDRRFDTVKTLRCHNLNQHRNKRSCRSVEDKSDSETETEKLLPLEAWLKIQKENPNNVIALEPDNFVSETVKQSSPVKCSLCQLLLTTEFDLRNHVKTCWKYNKTKHCYCVPCNQHFVSNNHLLLHSKAKHRKYPTILFTCLKCNHEFLTKSELTKHTESLQEFSRHKKNYAIAAKQVKSVNTTDSSNTMSYLYEWLKRLRQIKNLDGMENIILVHPEPTADNFEEINSDNPITCRLCQQKFNTARGLNRHVRNCWTQKKEIHRFCVTCKKVFETPQNLQDHSRMEHSDVARASFICKFCSQEFFDEKIFEEHEETHEDPNFLPFKCTHCSAAFNAKNKLLKHMTTLHRRRRKVAAFKCRICLKPFLEVNLLNDHNRRAHTGERPFECKFPNCSSAFYSKQAREVHYHSNHRKELGLESQQFLCPTCGKTFTLKRAFYVHRTSHRQDKPYKCTHDGCTKAYKVKPALTEHVRVHTGEKPYVCEECGKSFSREWTFRKHKRSHQGTLNRAQCHLCPRKFLGGWELKQHLKIHQEKKQFKCQFCEVQCATQSYLKKHEKTHGNEPDSNSDDESNKSSADSDV